MTHPQSEGRGWGFRQRGPADWATVEMSYCQYTQYTDSDCRTVCKCKGDCQFDRDFGTAVPCKCLFRLSLLLPVVTGHPLSLTTA